MEIAAIFRSLAALSALALPACAASEPLPQPEPLHVSCSVTDGDTIRCGGERVRLLGIDAPEFPGKCREGRDCAPGDPWASTEALRGAMAGRKLSIRRFGYDRYGRALAEVFADGENLSCSQVQDGQAIYVRRWDNEGRVRQSCPDIASLW